MTTIENLQLQETAGASPEDHLSGRFKTPEGWVLVPIEPNEHMIVSGFEAVSEFQDSEDYYEMSGCEGSSESAKICWESMIKAAPKFGQATKQNPILPDGYALIKKDPDHEILWRMTMLINNLLCNGTITEMQSNAVYKLIAGYAPKHNQD